MGHSSKTEFLRVLKPALSEELATLSSSSDSKSVQQYEAERILNQARIEADEILNAARENAKVLEEKLSNQKKLYIKRIAKISTKFIDNLAENYEKKFDDLENTIASIALDISKTIIGKEIPREVLLNLVKENLKQVDSNGVYQLMLHPSNELLIDKSIQNLNAKFPHMEIKIISSLDIPKNVCRLIGPFKNLEISSDIAIQNIEDSLIQVEQAVS